MAWSKGRTMKLELWEVKFKVLNKISDSQQLKLPNSLNSSVISSPNMNPATLSLKLTDKRFKNSWIKISNLEKKWTTPKKTWDSQLLKSENLTINWKSPATKMKPFKGVFSKLEQMLAEESVILKENLDYWLRNLKDWMESSRERTTKLELLEVKFKKPKRISDYLLLRHQRWVLKLLTIRTDSKRQMKNQKPTNRRFRNYWAKTTNSEMR